MQLCIPGFFATFCQTHSYQNSEPLPLLFGLQLLDSTSLGLVECRILGIIVHKIMFQNSALLSRPPLTLVTHFIHGVGGGDGNTRGSWKVGRRARRGEEEELQGLEGSLWPPSVEHNASRGGIFLLLPKPHMLGVTPTYTALWVRNLSASHYGLKGEDTK